MTSVWHPDLHGRLRVTHGHPGNNTYVADVDEALERHILDLLSVRDAGKTICVSEAARAAYREPGHAQESDEGWRELMEPARQAARRLVARGEVVVTQHGEVVDLDQAKGPIRVRLAR